LGNAMLNRRLGKMARLETSAFISAGVGSSNFFDVAEFSGSVRANLANTAHTALSPSNHGSFRRRIRCDDAAVLS